MRLNPGVRYGQLPRPSVDAERRTAIEVIQGLQASACRPRCVRPDVSGGRRLLLTLKISGDTIGESEASGTIEAGVQIVFRLLKFESGLPSLQSPRTPRTVLRYALTTAICSTAP